MPPRSNRHTQRTNGLALWPDRSLSMPGLFELAPMRVLVTPIASREMKGLRVAHSGSTGDRAGLHRRQVRFSRCQRRIRFAKHGLDKENVSAAHEVDDAIPVV